MYYRRHRRSFRRRYARKHVFGKKATRAIKAISQKPAETKWSVHDVNLGNETAVGPFAWSGDSHVIAHNIWGNVYRADSVGVRSRSEVLGQSCMARGFSLRWAIYYPAEGTGVGQLFHLLRVRISVVKVADYFPFNLASEWDNLSPGSLFFDDEDSDASPPTLVRFNMDAVKVMKTRTFTLSSGGQKQFLSEGKMWVPMRAKITAADAEPTVGTSSQMGKLKGWNYYCLLEFYDPAGLVPTAELPTGWQLILNTKVYFKDA